ncbi:MAG: GIY-YIG nuclease family protein [Proteobacteria bacterium]|nr:GIY-YIG nuclease family protein [Pseudomonadota bacterium]
MTASPRQPAADDSPASDERPLARGRAVILASLPSLPPSPGVYRMISAKGDVLYVGKAKNLNKRVASYAVIARQPTRTLRMVAQTASIEVVSTHTEVEALLLEANLIKRLRPRYNILLRDDKSFPYILITGDHPWPRITKHRGARKRDGEYFGPFASAGAVNQTVNALARAFPLRSCSDSMFASRSRPCLQYQIKRCTAPCVGRIEAAEESGYSSDNTKDAAADGSLPNAGSEGAPRIRRCALPRKTPTTEPCLADGDLADKALARRLGA